MNKAYLEITMKVPAKDRVTAGEVTRSTKFPAAAQKVLDIDGTAKADIVVRERRRRVR